ADCATGTKTNVRNKIIPGATSSTTISALLIFWRSSVRSRGDDDLLGSTRKLVADIMHPLRSNNKIAQAGAESVASDSAPNPLPTPHPSLRAYLYFTRVRRLPYLQSSRQLLQRRSRRRTAPEPRRARSERPPAAGTGRSKAGSMAPRCGPAEWCS